jgi:hypothetical protein
MLCLTIIILGMAIFAISSTEEFEKKSIYEINEGEKALVFGKIEYIIKQENFMLFVISDGNSITVYYPKKIDLKKNDFVNVYGEKQYYNGNEEFYAHKVVKE